MQQRNAGASVLQRLRERPLSTTGFVLALIPLALLACAQWGSELQRLIAIWIIGWMPHLPMMSSKTALVVNAGLNAILLYAIGWFIAWKLPSRRQRAGLFAGLFASVVASLLLPLVIMGALAFGAAWLWHAMSNQHGTYGHFETHTEPSPEQAAALRKRAEDNAQRTAARLAREAARRTREAEDRELEREYTRMAEEARGAPPAPQPPVIAPPRPQGEERCVGNQRMRRLENGWEQAGAC